MGKTKSAGTDKFTLVSLSDVQRLARVLKPFASKGVSGPMVFGLVAFSGGMARAGDGVVGVDTPFDALDSVSCPVAAFAGPALSAKADVSVGVVGGRVHINAGGFRGNFAVASASDAPSWPEAPPKKDWVQVTDDGWAGAMSGRFASDPGQRPGLSGVQIRGCVAVAVDGVRLARAAAKGMPDVFIPTKLLDAVSKAFPSETPSALLQDAGGKVWLRFDDGTACWATLPADAFPQEALVAASQRSEDAGKTPSASWEVAEASAAVARVEPFADGRLTVRATGKTITFRAESQHGEAEEAVAADVTKPFDVDVSPPLLVDAVGRANSCAVPPSGDCVVFRAPAWELVIMGMRQ